MNNSLPFNISSNEGEDFHNLTPVRASEFEVAQAGSSASLQLNDVSDVVFSGFETSTPGPKKRPRADENVESDEPFEVDIILCNLGSKLQHIPPFHTFTPNDIFP